MDHLLSAESVIAEEGSFWGALNRAATVHRLQAPLMDTLLPRSLSLSVSLSFPIHLHAPSLSLSLHLALSCIPSLSFRFCLSAVCLRVRANLRGRVSERRGWWTVVVLWSKCVCVGGGLFWEGRGFCLFGQMHRPISELLSVIKAADDVEQIHGPCLISPCSSPHPSS